MFWNPKKDCLIEFLFFPTLTTHLQRAPRPPLLIPIVILRNEGNVIMHIKEKGQEMQKTSKKSSLHIYCVLEEKLAYWPTQTELTEE